jgi:hypothetical protein
MMTPPPALVKLWAMEPEKLHRLSFVMGGMQTRAIVLSDGHLALQACRLGIFIQYASLGLSGWVEMCKMFSGMPSQVFEAMILKCIEAAGIELGPSEELPGEEVPQDDADLPTPPLEWTEMKKIIERAVVGVKLGPDALTDEEIEKLVKDPR